VIVGDLGAAWSYDVLQHAFAALQGGAELIACSRDRYYRRDDQLVLVEDVVAHDDDAVDDGNGQARDAVDGGRLRRQRRGEHEREEREAERTDQAAGRSEGTATTLASTRSGAMPLVARSSWRNLPVATTHAA